MTEASLAAVAESLTISFEDTAEGGLLHRKRDQTRFSVPITVR